MIFFSSRHTVQYYDTDQMGIVHHSNYAKYYESARIEMLKSVNISYRDIEKTGIIMPVYSLNIKYIKPLYYDDQITVNIYIKDEIKTRIKFYYEIYNQQNEMCNKAEIEVVFLDRKTNKIIFAPNYIVEAIKSLDK